MKKGLAILLGIILVAGCSSNDTDELEPQEQEESNEIVDSDENLEDESTVLLKMKKTMKTPTVLLKI